MARKISVEIVGDSRSLERAFARSSRSATKFQGSITGMTRGLKSTFAGLGVALGVGTIAKGMDKAIEAASDLNEQTNRSRVLFGRSSSSIVRWSKTTANAIGVSSAAALEAAGNFGGMFETVGLADQQAAAMSRRLTILGADLASFNNEDPSDMLDRLRSGLAGEAEPLRRFGVLLSEARVKQEAYRSGLARTGAKLTEGQKVLARYALILRDTRVQQGDFARTSESWANVQRRLSALLEDTAAKLGTVLLPIFTKYANKFAKWLGNTENQKRLTDDLTASVEALGTALGAVATGVEGVADAWSWFRRHTVTGRIQDIGEAPTPSPEDLRAGLAMSTRRNPWADAARRRRRRAIGGGGAGAGAARAGLTTAERITRRNQFFDTRVARQLDRLQDLSLRKQLARLRQIGQEVRARLSATQDATRRLTLEDKLLEILRQQRGVQKEIGDQVRATNAALKERADAIKSAVLERLQRRQTDILNRRALADAREQLRIARQIGGPMGIRAATRELQDVRFEALRARLEAAPATLTRAGRFQLGNVITINIHGVTDPDAVARKVTEILQRRSRRTTTQTRGPAAGAYAGAH